LTKRGAKNKKKDIIKTEISMKHRSTKTKPMSQTFGVPSLYSIF